MARTRPPGPRFAPIQAARFVRGPIEYLEGRRRRHGDVFSVPFPVFGRIVYLAHPDLIKRVFTGDPGVFAAGEANAGPLEPLLGTRSVFILDDEEHMRERRLLLPPFHGERVKGYAQTMIEATEREVATWPVGEPFELRERMQRLTLEVILRTVFGMNDPAWIALYEDRLRKLGSVSNPVIWTTVLRRGARIPLSPWRRFLHARARADELVYEAIDRARSDPRLDERDDILALLLAARREDGSPMTREELRDELVTLIAAGHETTATGLSWFFERVLRHPEVEERLREGDDDYLEATVRETLRVRPVIADVIRRTRREVELGGHVLPAGTNVVPGVSLVQRRADVYPDPHEFRPERFLGDEGPPQYTWIPFGGGVRRCVGAAFAMLEMKVVARTILDRARLRAPNPRPERARAEHVTVVPARGARVVVEERVEPGTSVTAEQRSVTAV